MVSHNSAAHLRRLTPALLSQLQDHDELLIVDNLSSDGSAAVARELSTRLQVIESSKNVGFASGCHTGAERSTAPLLMFLNPDAVPQPGCLQRLRAAAIAHPDWGAWQAAVLMPNGTINTDGGVIHFLGMGWAGDCGQPATWLPREPQEIAFPSGAALVVRRAIWDGLGGFDRSYFMYAEDLDFGLRLWLSGSRVGIVPDAAVIHDYEFDKGTKKWYLLERNRWRTLLAVYPTPLLAMLAPALIAAELGLLFISARDGWLPLKLRAQAETLLGLPELLRRRRVVQSTRRIESASFASHLTASLDSTYLPIAHLRWAVNIQRRYWATVRRLLRLCPE